MDKDAQTPVFLRHRALLGAVARKYLIPKEDVEDALQELFIRAWENRKTDTTPQQKRAFLFTSLRNICVDLLRKRKLRGGYSSMTARLPPNHPSRPPTPSRARTSPMPSAARLSPISPG